MERQFLRVFFLLFFLVGCQQVEINKLETTAKEKNLELRWVDVNPETYELDLDDYISKIKVSPKDLVLSLVYF